MPEDPSGNVYLGIATTGNGGSFTDPSIGPVFSTGDYLLYKIDAFGIKIWDKRYGGTGSDVLRHLSLSSKGEILLTGASKSPISGNKTEANLAEVEIWVLAVDSSGTVLWDKTIHNTGTNFEIYGATYATEDGCYTTFEYTNSGIGGYKSQANRDTTNAATDIWAIQYCFDTISGFSNNYGYVLATLYPNPASSTITLSGTEEGSTATITNIHGQVVQQFAIHAAQQTIDIESLPSGFYFCTLQNGQRREVLRFRRGLACSARANQSPICPITQCPNDPITP
ncbi:MAG: T9SS type A sorting domain-containing protein [Bacteroidetes bacterium]|nr:T9SS type A sorting domain-containing protein [Bacteroidota bacterium]